MNFTLGDHLKTSALLSSRHALYAGGGYVIENTAEGVRHLSLEDFAEDKEIEIVPHDKRRFSRSDCVERAISSIGEHKYSRFKRDDEKFVNWCIEGDGLNHEELYAESLYTLGDHLTSPRYFYTHHGLYVGHGMVVENTQKGTNYVSLREFADGEAIAIIPHQERLFSREESVKRALHCVGEHKYNVFINNCEHFVNWCIDGENKSPQVERAFTTAATVAIAGVAVKAAFDVAKSKTATTVAKNVATKGLGAIPAVKAVSTILTIKDSIATASNVYGVIKEGHADVKTAVKVASVAVGIDKDTSESIALSVEKGVKKSRDLIVNKSKSLACSIDKGVKKSYDTLVEDGLKKGLDKIKNKTAFFQEEVKNNDHDL